MKNIFGKTYSIKITKNLAIKVVAWTVCPIFFWLMGWNPLSTIRGPGLAIGLMVTIAIGIIGHFTANDIYPDN